MYVRRVCVCVCVCAWKEPPRARSAQHALLGGQDPPGKRAVGRNLPRASAAQPHQPGQRKLVNLWRDAPSAARPPTNQQRRSSPFDGVSQYCFTFEARSRNAFAFTFAKRRSRQTQSDASPSAERREHRWPDETAGMIGPARHDSARRKSRPGTEQVALVISLPEPRAISSR